MTGPAIAVDWITVAPRPDFTFETWYSNHYVPGQLRAAAYRNVQCYGSPLKSAYLAVCEGDEIDAVRGAEQDAGPGATSGQHPAIVDRQRYWGYQVGKQHGSAVCENPLDTPILYVVLFQVPEDRQAEFNKWYDDEHMPMLLASSHWIMCRRFHIVGGFGRPWTHLTLHHLRDLRALESPERDAARRTVWRERLGREAWFQPETIVFHRHGPRRHR